MKTFVFAFSLLHAVACVLRRELGLAAAMAAISCAYYHDALLRGNYLQNSRGILC
jgi:hypothetical protein